jgi:SAM-dependent methyltransferase
MRFIPLCKGITRIGGTLKRMLSTAERFNGHVEDYARYRPTYPREALVTLREEIGLTPNWLVADVGAGTGIVSRLILANGNRVIAVEPNAEMRRMARSLCPDPKFEIRDGSAESTGLDSGSIDLIVVGQAFHWFDADRAKLEFQRILTPSGVAALMWNRRKHEGSDFLVAFDETLRLLSEEYTHLNHHERASELVGNFLGGKPTFRVFDHGQDLDFEGFLGRVRSMSYIPLPGQPGYEKLIRTMHALFDRFATEGRVRIEYVTSIFWGRPS